MFYHCDSWLSLDDIGFYEKNGVEKNAMPLIFSQKKKIFEWKFRSRFDYVKLQKIDQEI